MNAALKEPNRVGVSVLSLRLGGLGEEPQAVFVGGENKLSSGLVRNAEVVVEDLAHSVEDLSSVLVQGCFKLVDGYGIRVPLSRQESVRLVCAE